MNKNCRRKTADRPKCLRSVSVLFYVISSTRDRFPISRPEGGGEARRVRGQADGPYAQLGQRQALRHPGAPPPGGQGYLHNGRHTTQLGKGATLSKDFENRISLAIFSPSKKILKFYVKTNFYGPVGVQNLGNIFPNKKKLNTVPVQSFQKNSFIQFPRDHHDGPQSIGQIRI